ncbi:MAG: hypothetical protein U0136_11055 [Bdellovibrionota bacterium]
MTGQRNNCRAACRIACVWLTLLSLQACAPTVADYQKRCIELGFTPDTPEMRNCVLQQDLVHQSSSAAIAAGAMSRPYPAPYPYYRY